jgi:hypothetical protein
VITALVVAATLLPVVVMGCSVMMFERAAWRRLDAIARPDAQRVTRTITTNNVATQGDTIVMAHVQQARGTGGGG